MVTVKKIQLLPSKMDGFCERENAIYKWMRTGGTPILGNPHIQGLGLMSRCGTHITQLYIGDISFPTDMAVLVMYSIMSFW